MKKANSTPPEKGNVAHSIKYCANPSGAKRSRRATLIREKITDGKGENKHPAKLFLSEDKSHDEVEHKRVSPSSSRIMGLKSTILASSKGRNMAGGREREKTDVSIEEASKCGAQKEKPSSELKNKGGVVPIKMGDGEEGKGETTARSRRKGRVRIACKCGWQKANKSQKKEVQKQEKITEQIPCSIKIRLPTGCRNANVTVCL